MHSLTNAPETIEAYDTPSAPDDDAIRLWQHIYGKRPDRMQVWSGFRPAGEKKKLLNPAEKYVGPDQRAAALEWAMQQDRMGREVYFCTHQLLADERTKPNAAAVLALWCETDGVDLAASPIKPTAVVESSPGHFHCYARLNHAIAPDVAEKLNKRWAKSFGADGSGFDLTQLLRVPGTRNHKYPDWPVVKLVAVVEDKTYSLAELDRVLPKLPEPASVVQLSTVAVSEDAQEVLTSVLEQPRIARVWQGDLSDYGSPSDAEWALGRELVRASGLNVDLAESIMRRCEALDRTKWDDRRGELTYLRYTLERAAKQPFTGQNATPYRSDDPSTWPELVAEIPDGPANGKCSDHCKLRHHPKEQALFRQVELINDLIQCDLSPVFKLTLLRLVSIVGYYQSRGTTRFQTSAKKIGDSIGLSAQSVRTVLHALARNDRDEINNEHGLIDLDSTRVPEGGPYCSVFDITPLTEGGYTGFLEAVVAFAPELPAPPKRTARVKLEEVKPPAEVVLIPGCPGDPTLPHPMHSDTVVDATCGGEFIREVRYTQNVTPYRSETAPPLWDISSDTPYRSESRSVEAEDLERLNALYDRAHRELAS